MFAKRFCEAISRFPMPADTRLWVEEKSSSSGVFGIIAPESGLTTTRFKKLKNFNFFFTPAGSNWRRPRIVWRSCWCYSKCWTRPDEPPLPGVLRSGRGIVRGDRRCFWTVAPAHSSRPARWDANAAARTLRSSGDGRSVTGSGSPPSIRTSTWWWSPGPVTLKRWLTINIWPMFDAKVYWFFFQLKTQYRCKK